MSVKMTGRNSYKLRPRVAKQAPSVTNTSKGKRARCPTCGAERRR